MNGSNINVAVESYGKFSSGFREGRNRRTYKLTALRQTLKLD